MNKLRFTDAFNFGKHNGKTVETVMNTPQGVSYLLWLREAKRVGNSHAHAHLLYHPEVHFVLDMHAQTGKFKDVKTGKVYEPFLEPHVRDAIAMAMAATGTSNNDDWAGATEDESLPPWEPTAKPSVQPRAPEPEPEPEPELVAGWGDW